MRRLAIVVGAVLIGSSLGFAIDVVSQGGFDAWSAARGPGRARPTYEPRGRTIDVEGRAVYVDCRGAGSPTVILEGGFGSGADGWGEVLDGVAAFTRVCAWDRPGIGRSAARGTHTARETTDDLRAALAGAGETGPFIVVAHSFGGVYARILAATSPAPDANPPDRSAVLALVMVDTYEPDLGLDVDTTLPDDMRAGIKQSLDETGAMLQAGERLDWAATLAELAAGRPVRHPTTFLGIEPRSRYADPDPVRLQALIDAWYRAIAALYPNGTLEIVPGASHFIHLDQPNVVLDRIRTIVEGARGA